MLEQTLFVIGMLLIGLFMLTVDIRPIWGFKKELDKHNKQTGELNEISTSFDDHYYSKHTTPEQKKEIIAVQNQILAQWNRLEYNMRFGGIDAVTERIDMDVEDVKERATKLRERLERKNPPPRKAKPIEIYDCEDDEVECQQPEVRSKRKPVTSGKRVEPVEQKTTQVKSGVKVETMTGMPKAYSISWATDYSYGGGTPKVPKVTQSEEQKIKPRACCRNRSRRHSI